MSEDEIYREALEKMEHARRPVQHYTGGTVVYSARVPREVRDAFEQIAAEENMTATDVLRDAMKDYLEKRVQVRLAGAATG